MTIRVPEMTPRSLTIARNRVTRQGVGWNFQRFWEEREDDTCRLFYPDYYAIHRVLRWRTLGAIKWRCKKLGLVKQSFHRWTARDISILRRLYPAGSREEICEAIPGVEWSTIRVAARYYGLRRNKKPYKITAVKALDEVRLRCYDLRWTMRDLDEECRTKLYFQTRGYRSEYPNFKAINRAVECLGGVLEVTWRD